MANPYLEAYRKGGGAQSYSGGGNTGGGTVNPTLAAYRQRIVASDPDEEERRKREQALAAIQGIMGQKEAPVALPNSYAVRNVAQAPYKPDYQRLEPDYSNIQQATPAETLYAAGSSLDKSGNLLVDAVMNPIANTFRTSDSARGVTETIRNTQEIERIMKDLDSRLKVLDENFQSGKIDKTNWIKQRKELTRIFLDSRNGLENDLNKNMEIYSPGKVAGDVLNSGVDIATGGIVDDLVTQFGKKAATSVGQRLALRGLEGAAVGTLGSTGYGLSEGKTLGEAVSQDAPMGALVGTGLGVATQGASETISKLLAKHEEKLAAKADEVVRLTREHASMKRKNTLEAKKIQEKINTLNEEISKRQADIDHLKNRVELGTVERTVKDKEAVKFNKQLEANRLAGEAIPGQETVMLAPEASVGKVDVPKTYPAFDNNIRQSFKPVNMEPTEKLTGTRLLNILDAESMMNQSDLSESGLKKYVDHIKSGKPIEPITIEVRNPENAVRMGMGEADFKIIDGHHRLQAAKQLGYSEIPVRYLYDTDGMSPKEIKVAENMFGSQGKTIATPTAGEIANLSQPTIGAKGAEIVQKSTPLLPGQIAEPRPEQITKEVPANIAELKLFIEKNKGRIKLSESKIQKLNEVADQLGIERRYMELPEAQKATWRDKVMSSRLLGWAQSPEAKFRETEGGRKFVAGMDVAKQRSGQLTYQSMEKLGDAMFNIDEKGQRVLMDEKKFNDIVEKEVLTGKVKSKEAKSIKSLLDDLFQGETDLGIAVNKRENYFPDVLDPSKKKDVVKYLDDQINQGKIKVGQGETGLDIYKVMTREVRPKKGGFEYAKSQLELPREFYIQDRRAALMNRIVESADRRGYAEVFGPKFENLDRMMRGLDSKEREYMQDIVSTSLFGVEKSNKLLQGVRATNVMRKLGFAWLPNATQPGNTLTKLGGRNALAGLVDYMTNKQGVEELAMKSGTNVNEVSEYLTEIVRGGSKNSPLVKSAELVLNATQFNRIERFNRLHAAATANHKFDEIAGAVAKNRLSRTDADMLAEYGIKVSDLKRPSEEVRDKFVYKSVGATQHYVNEMTMPRWTTKTELGKTAAQFKPFTVQQTRFLSKSVLKPLAHGDFAPLVRYVGWTVPAGTAVVYTKFKLITGLLNAVLPENMDIEPRGRETELGDIANANGVMGKLGKVKDFALESMGYAGGFGVADFVEGLKYGDTVQEKIANQTPTSSDLFKIGDIFNIALEDYKKSGNMQEVIDNIINDKYLKQQAAKFGASQVPMFSTYIKQGMSPYDPKSSELWETKNKLGLSSINQENINEATKIKREGGDISGTSFAGAFAYALNDPKRSDATKAKIKETAQKLGINLDAAGKFSKDYTNQKADMTKQLSKEEKTLLNMSETERNRQLKSMGKTIEDFPKLKERVNFSAKPAEIKSAVTGMLSDLSEQNKQEKLPPNTLVGNFILGLKTIFGQGPKDYEDKPTVVYEKNTGQNYGGLYYGDKDLIKIVKQDGPYAKEMENSVLTHENAHSDYQKMRNSNLFPTGLGPRDEQFVDNKFVETLMKEQPDAYEYIMKVLKESGTYGKNGENADVANELYAFFANNVKSYREGALPQKIESIITNRKQYEDENWSISDALMRYYGK